jgi:hypothetical protein
VTILSDPDAQREIVGVGGKEWVVLRRGTYTGRAMDPRVRHYSYIGRWQVVAGDLSHHEAPAGVHRCTICDRLVIRGQGRWWEARP